MKVYSHPRCSTCKRALKILDEANINYELIDITKESIPFQTLKDLFESNEYKLKKYFNTSGMVYRNENIKNKLEEISTDEALILLSNNGMLVKRPFIFTKDKLTIGAKESDILSWIK